jgi:hypothetical protein
MRGRIILIFLLFLCSAGVVSARQIIQADQCVVSTDERIEGNLFATCRTLVVDGRITGDLIGAAATTQINGAVEGSVYLLSGQLDVFGTIGQDLHFAGPILRIHPGAVLEEGDLISVSLSTVSSVHVPGSVVSTGYQTVLEGTVGREVDFYGTSLTVDAAVGGNVNAAVGDPESAGVAELRALLTPLEIELRDPGLYVTQDGIIGGQLTYSGPVEGEILAELPQEPVYYQMPSQNDISTMTESENLAQSLGIYISDVLREFITLTLVGVLVLLLVPRVIQAPVPTLRLRTLPSLGVGLITFILSFPVFFIIILLSIIFVLVLSLLQLPQLTLISGLIVGVVDFSAIGLFYFIAFIISRVIFALALGSLITRRLLGEPMDMRGQIISLLIGVAVLALLSSLPFVGWLVNALALFLGLGAILTLLHEELQRTRMQLQGVTAGSTIQGQPVPPPVTDEPRDPGLENLPEGFHWWE